MTILTQSIHKDAVMALLQAVPDPEIPVVSIAELGILRDVRIAGEHVEVVITPTYSGCPAMQAIQQDICSVLKQAGIAQVTVSTALSPAWSSDWITPAGRDKLRAYGIAPPQPAQHGGIQDSRQPLRFMRMPAPADALPACPQCGSRHTELLSEFGSTSCKALYRCTACREPFDYFKPY
ncbi:1,2-phenylacetyl-CoA epoxidase subunit PaaD [Undibacterium sp.]|jgi:ring-1,2-phenylacetyl-CoA epoxidase subunit PaaD|uniref:1,2-phenylacetyl-CoA epoxidase subunit PaaD n=1 Tax=Undibacterium sp. TaxID=1914977 RepID=UPI002B8FD984|nr:1,2-phenylacetyl-CoA epoxidase subunit PaaD [Undibacterium sp.]HTD04958.1 1,2-phenylacetyl-CoA epoxidase subunit PaaD [Undibacterium sp.]